MVQVPCFSLLVDRTWQVSRAQGTLAVEVAVKLQSSKWLRNHRDFLLPYLK